MFHFICLPHSILLYFDKFYRLPVGRKIIIAGENTTDKGWFKQHCVSECIREVYTLMDIIKFKLLTSEGVETLWLLDKVEIV